jgi:hypothetical protein
MSPSKVISIAHLVFGAAIGFAGWGTTARRQAGKADAFRSWRELQVQVSTRVGRFPFIQGQDAVTVVVEAIDEGQSSLGLVFGRTSAAGMFDDETMIAHWAFTFSLSFRPTFPSRKPLKSRFSSPFGFLRTMQPASRSGAEDPAFCLA